jgi:adenosylcobinamide-GDP ribazoletransferase
VVGLTVVLAYWIAVKIGSVRLLAALLAVAATAALTGALHEDGWADFADGLGARGDRVRKLAAMKDSHIGSFGVLALIFATGIKAAALWQLHTPDRVATAWSRLMSCPARSCRSPCARCRWRRHRVLPSRPGGRRRKVSMSSLGLGFIISFFAVYLPAAIVGDHRRDRRRGFDRRDRKRQFGGYTGDVLGAIEQVAEIAVLINWCRSHHDPNRDALVVGAARAGEGGRGPRHRATGPRSRLQRP